MRDSPGVLRHQLAEDEQGDTAIKSADNSNCQVTAVLCDYQLIRYHVGVTGALRYCTHSWYITTITILIAEEFDAIHQTGQCSVITSLNEDKRTKAMFVSRLGEGEAVVSSTFTAGLGLTYVYDNAGTGYKYCTRHNIVLWHEYLTVSLNDRMVLVAVTYFSCQVCRSMKETGSVPVFKLHSCATLYPRPSRAIGTSSDSSLSQRSGRRKRREKYDSWLLKSKEDILYILLIFSLPPIICLYSFPREVINTDEGIQVLEVLLLTLRPRSDQMFAHHVM
ncbi:hypothetical protein J6590_004066 [Homalodisca vitripennis]|nr:hypothetical protein J6590_004066 [Homalodisca vitripennis]